MLTPVDPARLSPLIHDLDETKPLNLSEMSTLLPQPTIMNVPAGVHLGGDLVGNGLGKMRCSLSHTFSLAGEKGRWTVVP